MRVKYAMWFPLKSREPFELTEDGWNWQSWPFDTVFMLFLSMGSIARIFGYRPAARAASSMEVLPELLSYSGGTGMNRALFLPQRVLWHHLVNLTSFCVPHWPTC